MAEDRGNVVLTAKDLTLSFGTHEILKETNLTVHQQDRIGIMGRNGSGKSTLLKILAGVDAPSKGDVYKQKNLRIGYLPQNFELDHSKTVLENVLDGAAYTCKLLEEYENLDPSSSRAADLIDEITHLDGWDLEQQAEYFMESLGTPPADKNVALLSGGEQRRVALCKTLISNPDFLILDEPTNHLDTESIEWLEGCLKKFRGGILLVTHDRYFLDRVTNRIFELSHGDIISYQGNYSQYLIKKAELEETAGLVEHKRQRQLKKELAWVRAGVKARTTKSKSRLNRYYEEAGKKSFEKDPNVDLIIPKAPQL